MTRCFRLLAAGLFLFVSHAAWAQQKIRMQTAVPSESIYFELLKRYADRVDRMSNGKLKIEVLPDGAIVPAFQILDAVDKGVVESGYAWTHYWSDKSPATALFSDPVAGAGVGLDQLSHMAWLYEGGGNELLQRLYTDVLKKNIVAHMVQPIGPEPLGWFKRPIKDVVDFRTMKYRAPPGITSEIFKEMGIAVVNLPGSEIAPAAQRGTIDAAEWIGPADDRNIGLHLVWKNYYLQGLHQSTSVGEILWNKDWYNKLPADQRAMLETASAASIAETYTFNVWRNAQALVELREKYGVQIFDTPKEFFPEFIKATNTVLSRYAAKDPFFKEVLDSQREFAKTVVPYWTKMLAVYVDLGNSAMKK